MNRIKKTKRNITSFFIVFMLLFLSVFDYPAVQVSEAKSKKIIISIKNCPSGKLTLNKGSKFALKVKAGKSKITYSSSNKKIAKVNSRGVVSAIREGTAKIKIKAKKGNIVSKKTIKIHVVPKSSKPTITVTNCSSGKLTLEKGSRYSLKVKAGKSKITYQSSTNKIIKVNSEGVISAIGTGTAKITIKAVKNKVSAKKTITVQVVDTEKCKAVEDLKIITDSSYILLGETKNIKIWFNPEGEEPSLNDDAKLINGVSNTNVTFSSSNTGILAINEKGVITAKKTGYADITAISCENTNIRYTKSFTVYTKEEIKDSDGDGFTDEEEIYMNTDPSIKDEDIDFETLPSKLVLADGVKEINITSGKISKEDVEAVITEKPEKNNLTNTLILPAEYKDLRIGETIAVNPCSAYPTGAALKISEIRKNENGNLLVTGKKPPISQILRYMNYNGELLADTDNIEWAEGFETVGKPVKKHKSNNDTEKKAILLPENSWGLFGSIEIKKVTCIKNFSLFSGEHYFNINVNGDAAIGCEFKADLLGEGIQPLTIAKIPVYGALGCGAYITLDIQFSAEGEVTASFQMDFDAGILLDGKGGEKDGPYFERRTCDVDISADVVARIEPRFGFSFELFGEECAFSGIKMGVSFEAKSVARREGYNPYSPKTCFGVDVGFSVDLTAEIDIDFCFININRSFEKNLGEMSLSDLLDKKLHWEDGKKVDFCTWMGEKGNSPAGLYENNFGELSYTWDELVDMGWITVENNKIEFGNADAWSKRVSNLEGKLVIPESITEIDFHAFYNCRKLKGIYIPKSISEIKSNTFFLCDNLEIVVLSEGLEILQGSVFGSCKALKDLELPSTLKHIGMFCFNGSGIEELHVPDNVSQIERNAFEGIPTVYYDKDKIAPYYKDYYPWGAGEILNP